jgi:hypothetical protein
MKGTCMDLLVWLEQTRLGTEVAYSFWIYPIVLTLHTVGLGFLVGTSAAIDLRILGVARSLPLAPMEKFYPVMYLGFWINALTGIVLFVAAASVMGVNRIYWAKMLFVVLGVVVMRLLKIRVFGDAASVNADPAPMKAKILAGASLFAWAGAITAGRFTAYLR